MENLKDVIDAVGVYVRAKQPVVAITTDEELRYMDALAEKAKLMTMNIRCWSYVSGFTDATGESLEDRPNTNPQSALSEIVSLPGRHIVVLKDFHEFLKADNPANVKNVRTLKELAQRLRKVPQKQAKTVVIIAPTLEVPAELRDQVAVLDGPLPTAEEIREFLVEQAIPRLPEAVRENIDPNNGLVEQTVQASRGMTMSEIAGCIARSAVQHRTIKPEVIFEGKKQAVKRMGGLEWMEPSMTMDDIAGIELAKEWLEVMGACFGKGAREFGISMPKGALFTGVAGCGKSILIEAMCILYGMPGLRFAADSIYGGLVGESEAKMRRVIKAAEASAPCILVIDEMEKVMAGSGDADAGTSDKVRGIFLTWAAEKSRRNIPVFLAATANDLTKLPPEMLRKGRWDEIFFVDLPHKEERRGILKVHLQRRNRNPEDFNLEDLATITEGYTGSEIEEAIETALRTAYVDGSRPVTTDDIGDALRDSMPLSEFMADNLRKQRDQAKGRTRPASAPPKKTEGETTQFDELDMGDPNGPS